MAKNLLAFLFLCLSLNAGRSQSFSIEPDTLLSVGLTQDIYSELYIYFAPDIPDTLQLGWRLVGNTLPEGWEYALCDYGQCYTGVPNTGQMAPLPPTETAYLKLILNPYTIAGSGRLSFRVFESETPDSFKTVHFDVYSLLTAVENTGDEGPRLYPNPTSDRLCFLGDYSKKAVEIPLTFSLVDLHGQKVLHREVAPSAELCFDLSGVPSNLYLAILQNRDGFLVKKKILVVP